MVKNNNNKSVCMYSCVSKGEDGGGAGRGGDVICRERQAIHSRAIVYNTGHETNRLGLVASY